MAGHRTRTKASALHRTTSRQVLIIVLLLSSMILSVSCSSTEYVAREPSEQECDYALHLVLDQTRDAAISRFFMDLNLGKISFVPDEVTVLEEKRSSIPGMDLLLSTWNSRISEALMASYDSFTNQVRQMLQDIGFENPLEMATGPDSSISNFLAPILQESLTEEFAKALSQTDLSLWDRICTQYNAWVETRAMLHGEENRMLDGKNILTMVCNHMTDTFFRYFAQSEALIRTTPDADMDPVQALVFNLD